MEGKIISDKTSKNYISNLDPQKRPVAAVADNNEIRNVISVSASINKNIKFKLLFNPTKVYLRRLDQNKKEKSAKEFFYY